MKKRDNHINVNTHQNMGNDTVLSPNMEDYMENISMLLKEHDVVRVKDIAKKLNIKMPSVTAALQKLKDKGLVDYEKYGHVQLTTKGKEVADSIYEKHSFLTEFFKDILSMDTKKAEEEACKLEHHLSSDASNRMQRFVEFYKQEQRDGQQWITRLDSALEEKRLSQLKEGEKAEIVRILGSGPLKKRLLEMGFRKGEIIHVIKYAPLKDPIEISLKDFLLSIRVEEANSIIVKPLKNYD
ncbi:MAG: metal-dependent transcriptional regulator [Spirochaetes bacterium]|nr:metal-dependent transcriptional regulator [Spirochaetota bacterium]